jgi:hypothetical protein
MSLLIVTPVISTLILDYEIDVFIFAYLVPLMFTVARYGPHGMGGWEPWSFMLIPILLNTYIYSRAIIICFEIYKKMKLR